MRVQLIIYFAPSNAFFLSVDCSIVAGRLFASISFWISFETNSKFFSEIS